MNFELGISKSESLAAPQKTADEAQPVNSPPETIDNVLPFYLRKSLAGQRVCLITVFHVDTAAPRPIGSQIAVAEDGESLGFITGGCAEAAIVHEALLALKENRPRKIRIGSESPWFDIKLPCGAGIELHFSVADSQAQIRGACEILAQRKPVLLKLDLENDRFTLLKRPINKPPSGTSFVCRYLPQTRLMIFGAGPYVDAIARIAAQSGYDLQIWSPDDSATRKVESTAPHAPIPSRPLSRRMRFPAESVDVWTATVLLFHEHDWEPRLLKSVLSTDCFYVGALGSQNTHAKRLKRLKDIGVEESQLNRIHGPVGLPIGAQTPAEIAISILAEIVKQKNLHMVT